MVVDSKANAEKLAQDLRVITLDLKMKMENDREAQLAVCSSGTMTELRGSDLKKKDETIELLKQRIEELSKSSDDLRRQSSLMSSRYTESLQQVKALESEALSLKQHVIEYQSQCEELAHGQRHALSKLTELDAENKMLKERAENPESGRDSQRGSRFVMRVDEAADRKFYSDLHATLMASLVHNTARPESDQLGNYPDAIDPQKLILKALSMLQERMTSISSPEIMFDGTCASSSSRVLSPPRGPNMHLQTRFTGAPASPSFVSSRLSLQTPSSVISTHLNSTKNNSGFV
jgi:DNA repair exonuclease SbcCD ATPase subunit